jgi:hypothetical protein
LHYESDAWNVYYQTLQSILTLFITCYIVSGIVPVANLAIEIHCSSISEKHNNLTSEFITGNISFNCSP